ncbi:MAG: LptF/LptG family permease [Bacteroidales bacterium]|nr:LptF/LptG family permease [Bacteroidales bacterium]
MKRLDLLLIKSFLGPLVLTFFMVIFILLMQFLWKYIDDLVGKGLDFKVIAEFLLYSSASMVPMALPLAVLLSSLMTFGNLAENLELLAFKSSGVALTRIMSSLFFVVIFITFAAFFFANTVMPVSNLKLRTLLHDIKRQRPELQIQPGIFDNTMEGYSIRIGDQDSKTKLLKDIWIYDHTDKAGNVSVTVADSGYMKMSSDEKQLILTLYNGNSYVELQKTRKRGKTKTYPHRRDRFAKREVIIEMTGFGLNRSDQNIWKNSFSMMNLKQLTHYEDSLDKNIGQLYNSVDNLITRSTLKKEKKNMIKSKASLDSTELASIVPEYHKINIDTAYNGLTRTQKRRAINQAINLARSNKSFVTTNSNTIGYKTKMLRRYQIEKHRKFTLALSCLIFFFIGAPLGAIIRKGGLGMPVIVSVLFFLVWYMISITGEKFVREDMITPFSGMWISTFILVPLGIFLSYKASTDSVIMNIESYFTFFKKLRTKLRKRILQVK